MAIDNVVISDTYDEQLLRVAVVDGNVILTIGEEFDSGEVIEFNPYATVVVPSIDLAQAIIIATPTDE